MIGPIVEDPVIPSLFLRDPRPVTRRGRSARLRLSLSWSLVVPLVWMAVAVAPAAHAGPWSQLPDAIDQLVENPGDEDAERVLFLAENSILREAQEGRVGAARTLFDTYASLVSNLPNGTFRLRSVERRISGRLLPSCT